MGGAESRPEGPEGQAENAVGSSQGPKSDASMPSALVICGPSGAGKGTLIKRLMADSSKFGFSCSHTTRSPRPGETNGKEYHFTDHATFERGISEGKFLEYAHVHKNLYGTTYQAVEVVGRSGRCCVLDIDVQGARLVRASSLKAVFVFVAPPSLEELERRLRGRGTEDDAQIRGRLAAAKEEMDSVKEASLYDYVLYNQDMEVAAQQLREVAERALRGEVGSGSQDSPVALTPPESSKGNSEEGEKGQQASTSQAETSASPAAETPTGSMQDGIDRWSGKVALVTGASAGIGWAICCKLATAGLRVVAVARRRERLEALQQHLVGLGVPIADFLPVVCDITKEAEVVALPRIVVKRWPGAGIDILVNNAGMGRDDAALFDGKTSAWVEMISTNVLGPCMCTREALQDMKRRGQWGHIINISSMAGHRVPDAAGSGSAFYSATKFALKALTEGLRQEARGRSVDLRVTQISPGVVETEFDVVMTYGNTEHAQERYKKMKCLQPEDVAQTVVWVISAPDHVDVHDIQLRPVEQAL